MLNPASIAAALAGLVGWHPAAGNPVGALHLADALLPSRSGLYVQDASELLTLDVLRHLVPAGETLESWTLRLHTDAILRFVPQLAQGQGLDGRVLLPQTPTTTWPGRVGNSVNKLSRFVGIQLNFRRRLGVRFSIPRLSLQLDGPLTQPLPLYFYANSQADPVAVLQLPIGNVPNFPYSFTPPVALALDFASEYGGTGYVGYYEDDLPSGVHALYRDFNGGPCGCANDPYAVWGSYVRPLPFSVLPGFLDPGRQLFDQRYVNLDSQNFGLSLDFFGYCDVATALQSADNQSRLAPLVQKAVAIRFLEALTNSPNITQLTARPDVQADAYAVLTRFQAQLYGGRDSSTEATYPSMLAKLTLDLTGLDAACQAQTAQRLSMGNLVR